MKIDGSWYIKPSDKGFKVRCGAGGVIVRIEKEKLFVCLVKEDGWDSYILPKGGTEDGETPLATAKREIGEETGLNNLKLILELDVKERLTFNKTYWSKMHYFIFITEQKDGIPTDPFENYKPQWFDIDKLPPMFWPEQKALIEENKDMIKNLIKKENGTL